MIRFHLSMALVLIAATLIGGGCSSDKNPASPGNSSAPENYEVTVTLEKIQVIGDCDEDLIFNLPGELNYSIKCMVGPTEVWRESARDVEAYAGNAISLSNKKKKFTLNAAAGQRFAVSFTASEDDVSGVDPRLNGSDEYQHTYEGNGDWGSGSHTLTVGSSDFCKVRLHYSVSSRRL